MDELHAHQSPDLYVALRTALGTSPTRRRPVWLGVDVGGSRAASAVVWVTEDLRVGVRVFQGDAAVLDCIVAVCELAGRQQVVEVAFDPWRFQQAALELEQDGLPVVQFPWRRPLPRVRGAESEAPDARTAWMDLREQVLARDRYTCAYCGGLAGQVDHVVPLAKGGSNALTNLVAACRRCNNPKGAS